MDIRPSDDDRKRAFDETQTLLKVHPEVKLIMAIASPAVPGAAEAVKQSGRTDVKVIGLGLPNASQAVPEGRRARLRRPLEHDGPRLPDRSTSPTRWPRGTLKQGPGGLTAGRLGATDGGRRQHLLGTPFTFTKDNVDQFDF